MTDAKPYRHRFPMTIIQHAIWLYHPLSYQDVQELLHQRGIEVSHETLREWCIKFDTAGLLRPRGEENISELSTAMIGVISAMQGSLQPHLPVISTSRGDFSE